MNLYKIVLPVCCLLLNGVYLQAQEAKSIETYTEAEASQPVHPQYPYDRLRTGEEGWVLVNFMVDEAGNTFEPAIVDSMGDSEFEKQALKALKETKFTPAKLSGNPVTSSHKFRYSFFCEDHPHEASPAFVRKYKWLIHRLNKDDRGKSKELISELNTMGSKSLYENAYLNLANFYYAVKYGDSESQLHYLSRALYFDNINTYETYLPYKVAKKLWPQLFVLQFKNFRFAEALETLEIIRKVEDDKTTRTLAPATKQIESIRNDETAYKIAGKTNEYGYWNIRLFKDEFYLDKVQLNIDEIKLRCEKKYIFFKFTPNAKYKIPAEYGKCNMEILGDPNISFELVQL